MLLASLVCDADYILIQMLCSNAFLKDAMGGIRRVLQHEGVCSRADPHTCEGLKGKKAVTDKLYGILCS